MFNTKLAHAVENFAALMLPLTEKDLERAWTWKDHYEEGIRFAFFVTLQELRHLAVTLSTLRPKPTAAQHILSQYHAAYLDLQAAIVGITPEDEDSHRLSVTHSRVTAQAPGNPSGFQMRMRSGSLG